MVMEEHHPLGELTIVRDLFLLARGAEYQVGGGKEGGREGATLYPLTNPSLPPFLSTDVPDREPASPLLRSFRRRRAGHTQW